MNEIKNETKITIQLFPDENTMNQINGFKEQMNMKSTTDAVRILINKGYDTHIKERELIEKVN